MTMVMIMDRSVGVRIKKTRKKRGMTQEELGLKVNVSPQVVSNWEREYTTPDSSDIQALSKVLDVSADYLLGHTDIETHFFINEEKSTYGVSSGRNSSEETIRLLEEEARKMGLSPSDPKFLEMLSNAFKMLRIARGEDKN